MAELSTSNTGFLLTGKLEPAKNAGANLIHEIVDGYKLEPKISGEIAKMEETDKGEKGNLELGGKIAPRVSEMAEAPKDEPVDFELGGNIAPEASKMKETDKGEKGSLLLKNTLLSKVSGMPKERPISSRRDREFQEIVSIGPGPNLKTSMAGMPKQRETGSSDPGPQKISEVVNLGKSMKDLKAIEEEQKGRSDSRREFQPGTPLGTYANDNLLLTAKDAAQSIEKDRLHVSMSLGGTLNKGVALARDYLLKKVSFGSFGDRIAGQLGLSVGSEFRLARRSKLGDIVRRVDDRNYEKYGFPFRKSRPHPADQPIDDRLDSYIQEEAKKLSNSLPFEFVDGDKDYGVFILSNHDSFTKEELRDQVSELGNDVLGNGYTSCLVLDNDTVLRAGVQDMSCEASNGGTRNSGRKLTMVVYKNYPSGNEADIDKLVLPFQPQELSWNPNNAFVEIAAFSRNVPDYQFLGSSQEFSFEIDWYFQDGSYEDVVKMAKMVDNYSRPDGYKRKPPMVMLVGLYGYEHYLFYIKSAPYRITEKTGRVGAGPIIYPKQIIQTVTLQRVSNTNPRWDDYTMDIG